MRMRMGVRVRRRRMAEVRIRIGIVVVAFLFLFLVLICIHPVFAQPGFVSLDCGLEAGRNYTDDNGITWVSDAAYLQPAGLERWSKTITLTILTDTGVNQQALKTLRYFPGGLANQSKYCYELPGLVKNQYYLLRAIFYYGNYDNQNRNSLVFSFIIDNNLWPVIITNPNDIIWKELYIPASSEHMSICIGKTDPDSEPFISSLELRPLDNTMSTVEFLKGKDYRAMDCYYHINYGDSSNSFIRYPQDSLDRIWYPLDMSRIAQTTTDHIVDIEGNVELPPTEVMQTTFGGANSSIIWSAINITSDLQPIFINLYFAEIDNSVISAGTRVFDSKINGLSLQSSFDIFASAKKQSFKAIGVYTKDEIQTSNLLNFSFQAAPTSLLPPIISALEIMRVSDAPLSLGTASDDVSVIQDIQKSFQVLTNWSGDPCFPFKFNWVTCSSESPPRITELILSNYNLSGSIPSSLNELTEVRRILLDRNLLVGPIPDLSNLMKIQTLGLSNNFLNGSIPSYLGSLPSLSILSLQNNNFSGVIPQTLLDKSASSGISFEYQDNQYLCDPGKSCSGGVPSTESEKDALPGYIVGVIVSGIIIFALAAVGIVIFMVMRSKKNGKVGNPTKLATMLSGEACNHEKETFIDMNHTRIFTYEEIQVATDNFRNKLGEGGYGPVYLGTLVSGCQVAVKLLSTKSHQGSDEFTNEVNILSRVHHKNLVSLLGYCTNKELILVYEFMPGGTLRDHLYGNKSTNPLSWKKRLVIALGAAQGLDYLHTMCQKSIIHRDVKSDNILLDGKYKAKVSDFGISKSKETEHVTHVSTRVIGTAGYLDPEYSSTQQLTDKSDVYSFGIVLLEIICGRPPIVPGLPSDQLNIIKFVWKNVERNDLENVMDNALQGEECNMQSVWKVAELGLRCTQFRAAMRPTMSEVVSELNYAVQVESGTFSEASPPQTSCQFV